MEVELLIRAHFCFNIAHNVQGTTDVLKLIKDRVNVREKEPALSSSLPSFDSFIYSKDFLV